MKEKEARKLVVPGIYKHFKNKLYLIYSNQTIKRLLPS